MLPTRRGAGWAAFIVCFTAWTLTNVDQALFGYAVPGILAEFRIPLETVGVILTISFLSASLFVILAGLAAERFGRAPTLAVLLAASALAVGAQGLAPDVVSLTVLRALGFSLSAGLAPLTNSLVVERAPTRLRGLVMGLLQCGYPLGWLLASLVAAPLLQSHGWRGSAMVAFAVVPAAPVLYLVMRAFGLGARVDSRAAERALTSGLVTTPQGPRGGSVRRLFSREHRRTSLAAIGIFFLFGGAYAGSALFFPTFFTQARGYSPSTAALLVGLSNGIAAFGYLAAAAAGEFLASRRNVFVVWCLAGCAALLALLWLSHGRTSDLVLYGLTAALFYGSQAVVIVFVAECFPASIRTTALACCTSAPLSLGFAVFPLVMPLVIARIGWEGAFSLIVAPLLAASGLCALLIPARRSGLSLEDHGSEPKPRRAVALDGPVQA